MPVVFPADSFCGLISRAKGVELSPEMLDVCRYLHLTEHLKIHDLTIEPHPYATASIQHAACVGILNHFEDLEPVFLEVSLILKSNGVFGFVVADRRPEEQACFNVQRLDSQTIMFLHRSDQIGDFLDKTSFEILK
ncbi:methyltransferase domain-containing protein [candidate division KSB1 bacterium]|nr:methyltransferase domain-containing protein [candidate division KSB1 bacterium]